MTNLNLMQNLFWQFFTPLCEIRIYIHTDSVDSYWNDWISYMKIGLKKVNVTAPLDESINPPNLKSIDQTVNKLINVLNIRNEWVNQPINQSLGHQ